MLSMFKTEDKETFAYPSLATTLKTIFEDTTEDLRLRTMSLAELVETRQNLLVPEGWPGMKHTLAATYANDQNGFYLLEKAGKKIASIAVVTYPEINFAYIGLYVVSKALRGQGYGKLIINKTIEHAMIKHGITTFGLNCVESAAPMYQNYGFKIATIDEFWKYTAPASKPVIASKAVILDLINDNLFADLVRFDTSILGANRTAFLRNFLFKPNTTTVIVQEAGKVQGYGVISARDPAVAEEHKSYRIGPLYADNASIAANVLEQLLTVAKPQESIYFETPGNNSAAAPMAKALGFEKVFMQYKMFKGTVPNFDTDRMFCYSSIAIGG